MKVCDIPKESVFRLCPKIGAFNMRLLLCIFMSLKVFSLNGLPLEEPQVWGVAAVSGNTVGLPCFLNPRTQGDKAKLILWYKRGIKTPIFTHDGRLSSFQSSIQKSNLQLRISKTSANLTLVRAALSDKGLYECRIDFFRSPTHTGFVNLSIIDPPYSVEIFDEFKGSELNGIVGPYLEGETLKLTCIARGGTPRPNITWWYEKSVLHTVSTQSKGISINMVKSEFRLKDLSRKWHNRSLTCSAANSRLVHPVISTVRIQMHLLPQSVLVTYSRPAIEGKGLRLKCVTWGSTPPARISWTVRGAALPPEREEILNHGESTSSTLFLNITRDDNESKVTCRATNPDVPKRSIFNSTVLIVHYPPIVEVVLGQNLSPRLLKEGDDVYFTCRISANPPSHSVKWYHNGKLVNERKSRGIILSGNSLVLQKVHRSNAGQYKCSASNYMANVTSQPVPLHLKYKPECKTSPTTYFIYDTPINVTCTVSSHPAARRVQWRWNTGTDVISSQPFTSYFERRSGIAIGKKDQASARLTVYPSKNPEDRELACWAANEMGKQKKPCTFSIKVAKTPAPLSSCRLANITASSLSLTCDQPDINLAGGTIYTAEVYLENSTLFANVTSNIPSFNVSRLDPGTSYQIKVYVSYGLKTSQPVVVSAYTSRSNKVAIPAESRPAENESSYANVFSLIATLAVAGCVVVIVGKIYCYRRRRRMPQLSKEENIGISDEENPDVVPAVEIEGPL